MRQSIRLPKPSKNSSPLKARCRECRPGRQAGGTVGEESATCKQCKQWKANTNKRHYSYS